MTRSSRTSKDPLGVPIRLEGEFVSDFAELGGNLYALTWSGLHGSIDHRSFEPVAAAPPSRPFDPVPAGGTLDAYATASLAAFLGRLVAGSSRDGRLYVLEAAPN